MKNVPCDSATWRRSATSGVEKTHQTASEREADGLESAHEAVAADGLDLDGANTEKAHHHCQHAQKGTDTADHLSGGADIGDLVKRQEAVGGIGVADRLALNGEGDIGEDVIDDQAQAEEKSHDEDAFGRQGFGRGAEDIDKVELEGLFHEF